VEGTSGSADTESNAHESITQAACAEEEGTEAPQQTPCAARHSRVLALGGILQDCVVSDTNSRELAAQEQHPAPEGQGVQPPAHQVTGHLEKELEVQKKEQVTGPPACAAVGTSEAGESRARCLARDLPPPPAPRVCIRDGSEGSPPRRATRTLSPPHYPLTFCSEADMGALRKSQKALFADALVIRALPSPPPLRSLYTLLCVRKGRVCVCVCSYIYVYTSNMARQRVRELEYLCPAGCVATCDATAV
jgi:hypothetical protein